MTVPFALVHATLGAVAAGELEPAFERLLPELRELGVRRGALYAFDGELRRLAGESLGTEGVRRLTLYDGYDVVGELRLELDGTEPVDLLELLQDVFGLGLGRRVRMNQLDLVNAAVAVNSAESLDEALDALAEAFRRVAGVPTAMLTVWEPDLSSGLIRAAAGDALLAVGEPVAPGAHVAFEAASTGRVAVTDRCADQAVGRRLRAVLARHELSVAVPLTVDGGPTIAFQAAWPSTPKATDVERTITTARRLGSLTSVAFRAAEERTRAAQNELLRTVIETVPDGVYIRRGDEVIVNAGARAVLGRDEFRAGDIAGYDLRRPDGTPASADDLPVVRCRETGKPEKARLLVDVGGADRVIEFKVAPMPDGFVGLLRDVTDEHAEQALTQEFLERLFATLPLAAVVLDAETGEVLQVNEAFEQLVGFPPEEVRGSAPPHRWLDHATLREPHVDARRRFDAVYRRKDGRAVPVELLRFRVSGAAGSPGRIVLLAQDMTERREFDRRLIQSGKLAAIGELASGVAHEINNPLFAILGLAEFLLRDVEEGTKAHERLLLIQQTGLEIKEIVKALLDFARERTDDHRPMPLRDVVAETVELVRRTSAVKDVEIVERYAEEHTATVGSPNQIKQVLLNLITNAQHAMRPDGGTITVSVEPDGDSVVASVTDTGPGIEPDVLERIFEPFFTTKRDTGGTGLGLAVSHGIAEMHGGTLTAESPPGAGATFRLRLPRVEEDA